VNVRHQLFLLLSGVFLLAALLSPAATTTAGSRLATNQLPTYNIIISREHWAALQRSVQSDERYPAKLAAGGKDYSVEIRYRGDWARTWPKKPLKIFFTNGQAFEGQRVLNFNPCWRDPAFVRELVAYRLYAAAGVSSPRARMARLQLNGQFHGLFVEVEQPDKPFLKRLNLKGSAIYKADSPSNTSDERDLGSERNFAIHYEKQSRKQEDYRDLQEFCRALATTTNVADFFHTQLELDEYISFLAVTAFVQNWDSFNKNHFLMRDTLGSKKWRVIPWDLDRTLGDHWSGGFDRATLPLALGVTEFPGPTGWNRLYQRFFHDTTLRNRLLDRLEALLRTEFTTEKLFPMIDQLESELSADVKLDRQRWPNRENGDLHDGLTELKRYIEKRRAFLRREITNWRSVGKAP
jgi:spore coat protein H